MASAKKPTENVTRGLLLALLAIPLGMIVWVIIWQLGYVASLASFVIAIAALWLYEKGAGAAPSMLAGVGITAIIIIGVMLSFVSGVVVDGYNFYGSSEYSEIGVAELSSSEKLKYSFESLGDNELWASYSGDFGMTAIFTVLGAGYVVYAIFKGENEEKPAAKK